MRFKILKTREITASLFQFIYQIVEECRELHDFPELLEQEESYIKPVYACRNENERNNVLFSLIAHTLFAPSESAENALKSCDINFNRANTHLLSISHLKKAIEGQESTEIEYLLTEYLKSDLIQREFWKLFGVFFMERLIVKQIQKKPTFESTVQLQRAGNKLYDSWLYALKHCENIYNFRLTMAKSQANRKINQTKLLEECRIFLQRLKEVAKTPYHPVLYALYEDKTLGIQTAWKLAGESGDK
jgi:hypothetical protein